MHNSIHLKRTMETVIAAAWARDDLAAQRAQSFAQPTYRFRLLAAADAEIPALPQEAWTDTEHRLEVKAAVAGNEIRLTLQASGFAALEGVSKRQARLHSADGRISLTFTFDKMGKGFAVVADTPALRRSLTDFCVRVGAQDPDA